MFSFCHSLQRGMGGGTVPRPVSPYAGNCFLYCKIDKRSHYVCMWNVCAKEETQQEAAK